MVLRDVVERHNVTNITALRALQRHLLANPGGPFTVQKFYNSLRSQGVQTGKDTLHDYLAHLQDAFLVRVLDMHSASERQRMVNPRKSYPIDPGLTSMDGRDAVAPGLRATSSPAPSSTAPKTPIARGRHNRRDSTGREEHPIELPDGWVASLCPYQLSSAVGP